MDVNNGGSPRFLGEFDEETGEWSRLMGKLKREPLRSDDAAHMNTYGKELYPGVRPDTLNRQL